MKLVEILAKEMDVWPEKYAFLTQSQVDCEIYAGKSLRNKDDTNCLSPNFYATSRHDERRAYPTVTRAQWQTKRDRQKGGEWKRHHGGKCPVHGDQKVEVKLRDGDIQQAYARCFAWPYDSCDTYANIMQFRVISQPQAEEEEVVPVHMMLGYGSKEEMVSQIGEVSPFEQVANELKWDQIDGPIKWRDTVNELDAYIEEFTREREALIDRLASEGFTLIPAMTPVMGVADISLPIDEWRIGDIVEVVSTSDESCAPLGVFKITDIDASEPKYELDDQYFPNHEQMKFIRRP